MMLTNDKKLNTKIIGYEWITDDLIFDDQIEGDAINVIFELEEYNCGKLTNSAKMKMTFFSNNKVYKEELLDLDNNRLYWSDEEDELYFARSFFDPMNENENNPEIMIDYLYDDAVEYLTKINMPYILKECHCYFGETTECDYILETIFNGETRKVLRNDNLTIDTDKKQVTITDKTDISTYTFSYDYNVESDKLEKIINYHTVIARIRYTKLVATGITEEPYMGMSKKEVLLE